MQREGGQAFTPSDVCRCNATWIMHPIIESSMPITLDVSNSLGTNQPVVTSTPIARSVIGKYLVLILQSHHDTSFQSHRCHERSTNH